MDASFALVHELTLNESRRLARDCAGSATTANGEGARVLSQAFRCFFRGLLMFLKEAVFDCVCHVHRLRNEAARRDAEAGTAFGLFC